MSRRNRYLVFGHYGAWNAGDEAILYSLLSMIAKRDPEANTRVVCGSIRPEASEWHAALDADIISLRQVVALLGSLVSRRLIVGGGQMITADKSMKGLIVLLVMLVINRCSGGRPVLLGIGVEGVSNSRSKWLVRWITRAACRIGVRDGYSRDQLLLAGCRETKIDLTADLVLGAELLKLVEEPQPIGDGPILVVLHHSPLRKYGGFDAYQGLIADLRRVAPERSLIILSHDCRERFDDGMIAQLEEANDDASTRFVRFASLPQVLQEYAQAGFVVSLRMHPLIIGTVLGLPWLAVGKSNKVAELVARFGAYHAPSIEEAASVVLSALADSDQLSRRAPSVAEARDAAWKNLDLALSV